MSELRDKQALFTQMVADLIQFAYKNGYELTFGDAYRDPRVRYGHPESLHKLRLAVDLNLFKNGEYLTDSEDHKPLGDYWKLIGGTWGGDFMEPNEEGELEPAPDGNHYSLEHEGRK